MPVFEVKSFRGGLSDYDDKGVEGSFKFGKNLNIRKLQDTLSANQDLMDIGDLITSASASPSASLSPSSSVSPSASPTRSPSASFSPTEGNTSPSASRSPSSSRSPSASTSPSASVSPSHSISLSPSPTNGLATVFADLIRYWVAASDGNTYGFGNTGIIYKVTPELMVYRVYNQGKQIKGAEESPASGGKTYLTWATNTEVHQKELPGDLDWNDVDASSGWPKTNLTSADHHTMKQINGATEIANSSTLAYIGYDRSYTNEAVNFIPGNEIKTIVERNARGIYGAYRKGYPNTGVNAAIDTELPLAQIGDDGELFYSNMNSFVYAKRFPGGGVVNPGGVTAEVNHTAFFDWDGQSVSYIDKQRISNLSLWGVYGGDTGYGGVYSYGRKNKNHPIVLNLEYALDVTEIGAVIVNNGNTLISYRSGSTFGVKAVDPQRKARAYYQSLDFKAPVKSPEKITQWKYAEVHMQPLPASCFIEFYYRVNKTGSFVLAKTIDGQSAYADTGAKKASFRIGAEGQIYEFQLILYTDDANNCPEVTKINTFFE